MIQRPNIAASGQCFVMSSEGTECDVRNRSSRGGHGTVSFVFILF